VRHLHFKHFGCAFCFLHEESRSLSVGDFSYDFDYDDDGNYDDMYSSEMDSPVANKSFEVSKM
jgi:hypothetical protein